MGKARLSGASPSRASIKAKVKAKVNKRSQSTSPKKTPKGKQATARTPSSTKKASATNTKQGGKKPSAKKEVQSRVTPRKAISARKPSTPAKKTPVSKSKTALAKKASVAKTQKIVRKSSVVKAKVRVANSLKSNAIKKKATVLKNKTQAKKRSVKKVVSTSVKKSVEAKKTAPKRRASFKAPTPRKSEPIKKSPAPKSSVRKTAVAKEIPKQKAATMPVVKKATAKASPAKKKTETAPAEKAAVNKVTPKKKVFQTGKGKLPSVVLRKAALSKTKAAKKTMRARLLKNSPGGPPSKKDENKAKSHLNTSKKTTKPAEVTKTFVSTDKTTLVTKLPVSSQRESSPQIRIDLTGAKPSPVTETKPKPDNLPQGAKPPPSPQRTEARKSAEEKLMKTLSMGPKQAQELVKTLYQQVLAGSGKSPMLQYYVSKDDKGNSVLRQIQSSKPIKPASEVDSQVSLDLSHVSPVKEQVISTPKAGISFDLTAAKPKVAKRAQEEEADDSEFSKKARVEEVEEAEAKSADESELSGKKKNVYYVKVKSKEAKDDRGLQEFLENRKAKRAPGGSEAESSKKSGKKSNIIVRCSACKNYFEPGKDFSSHKAECLKLHARCPGCQKYFQRGEEYDTHKAQCNASPTSEAAREQQNEARWEEVMKGKTDINSTPGSVGSKFRCLVCRVNFPTYKETRDHEEVCALVQPGEPKGVMCSDCKLMFKGRMFLSRHKTQYPGCRVKPISLQPEQPSPAILALQQAKELEKPINLQVTFHNGQPKVAVQGLTSEGGEKRLREAYPEGGADVKKLKTERIGEGKAQKKADAVEIKGQPQEKTSTEKFEDMTRVKGLKLEDGTPLSKCPLCDKLFKHTEFLKKHFKSFHNLDFELFVGTVGPHMRDGNTEAMKLNSRSETLRARFQQKRGCTCLDCGDWFISRLELNLHKRTCTKKISTKVVFPCTLCNEMCVFPTRVDLYEHMRQAHSEDAMLAQTLNYGCNICYSKFATQDELTNHEKEHYKAGVGVSGHTKRCLDCGLLVDASKLTTHKQKCTASLVSKPFVCFDCHAQFNTRTELTEHKRDEHLFSGAPYKCWQCMSNFNFYPDLIQHVMEKHRKDQKSAELLAQAANMTEKGKHGARVGQQVFKLTGDTSMVKLNVGAEKRSKSVVLDLSKLKDLMQAEGTEEGKKGILTLPASALAALAMDVEDGEDVKVKPTDNEKKKDDTKNKEEQQPLNSTEPEKEQETAVVELQPKDSEAAEEEEEESPAARVKTRSRTGTTPPRQGGTDTSPGRAKSPSAAPVPSPNPSSPAATPSPRKKHQPAILKRSSSSPKPSSTKPGSGKMLQPVGKDQVMCCQCNTVLATMQDVAAHKCLTNTKQWSMQKVEGSSDQEDVEWYVASS